MNVKTMGLFEIFESQGLGLSEFLDRYSNEGERARWNRALDQSHLAQDQRDRIQSFTRQINVLCMAGTWCGDCIEQCPIYYRFAEENPLIDLRFIDRDASETLQSSLQICGAARVPQLVFFSEDGFEVSRFGDRTLAKYRSMAQSLDGAACSIGHVSKDDPLQMQIMDEWLDEFERVHLILRLSPRLRSLHGD